MPNRPFWERKTLAQMTDSEWESLCDGCGKCCLHKLQDEDTDEIYFTDTACRQLDIQTGRCRCYANRFRVVQDCIKITLKDIDSFLWLPPSCAYRRLAEGKSLPDWHPLITGDQRAMVEGGHTVRGQAISEDDVDDLVSRIVTWPLTDESFGE